MFLDPVTTEVIDYVGGQDDLNAGIIRAIGNPNERFKEDKLRLVRAVRFSARFNFPIEPQTYDALIAMAPQIRVVAVERIVQELKRMLADPKRGLAMRLLVETGLLGAILPALNPVIEHPAAAAHTLQVIEHLCDAPAPSFCLCFAALIHALFEPDGVRPHLAADVPALQRAHAIAAELHLSNAESARIAWIVAHQHALRAFRELAIHERKQLMANPGIGDLLAFYRAEVAASHEDRDPLDYATEYQRNAPEGPFDPPPLVDGDDLKTLGLLPGPQFKRMLQEIRTAQLDGRIRSREDAFSHIARQARPE
jgi:tRNA nucleotidyltransferase/poly(A) polymerase